MRDEIKKQMTVTSQTAESVEGTFCFSKHFAGFQGHFPGRPVLPGICLVQAALVLAESLCVKPPVLQEVVSARFFSAVLPDCPVQMSCTLTGGVLKATVSGGAGRVAEIKLKVLCA
ncbi:MAG: hypothetical protein MUC65_08060 [Pontiellaceae bacterium]|jgi:3-hydroxymyristoyl/3-hydroxydecanoyl-(acyl carrier protein) dehydratase|nr:hypothetical protein [Pontiellaceae bacterium]